MAESGVFKEGVNASIVAYYAQGLGTVLDAGSFSDHANDGLEELELKARVKHIAAALRAHLDPDYPIALAQLMGMLDTAKPSEGPAFQFAHWPMAQFVEDHGLDHLEVSAAAMRRITRLFSCEFAVRPFLVRYPERMLAILHDWVTDPDVHVRRNASEGIRPRLPWGLRLQAYVDDPSPVFGLLERLRSDPEEYVRRSVSNCLNDVAKDHPGPLMDLLERWDADADEHSAWIKKRALRTLVKAGDPRALSLLGFGPPKVELEGLALDAEAYTLGDTLELRFTLVSTASTPQELVVDYRIHYVKKNGSRTPKVFKLKNLALQPGERVEFIRRQHLKPISTRRYHSGVHAVDVQVNGQVFDGLEFDFTVA